MSIIDNEILFKKKYVGACVVCVCVLLYYLIQCVFLLQCFFSHRRPHGSQAKVPLIRGI